MIPPNITPQDILKGIEKANLEGYRNTRSSDDYDLWYMGELYPPKVVVSYANIFANNVELPSTAFHGGDETNSFLTANGFPIVQKRNLNPTRFFTEEELSFFDHYSGAAYDYKDEINVSAGDYISNVVWESTKQWADKICQAANFQRFGRKALHELRNNKTGQAFKGYTWYKLCNKDFDNQNVFYTVGVEGASLGRFKQARLVIKLDCQRSKLDETYTAQFDQLLGNNNVEWHIFETDIVINGSWTTLIQESLDYINATFEVYKKAIGLFQKATDEKYARVTWNTNGWKYPSGINGKSKSSSHENEFGYGHEEWLFDFDKLIDGYKYGRLEPLDAKSGKHHGKVYDITLYTHDQEEKKWYWIGRIMKAEVITPELSGQIAKLHRDNEWLLSEVNQLGIYAGVNHSNYKNWIDEDRFNLRFRPEDVELYGLQEFAQGENPPSLRYVLAEKSNTPEFLSSGSEKEQQNEDGIDFSESSNVTIPKKTIRKKITEQLKELDNVHGILQVELMAFLKREFPQSKFGHEIRKISGNYRIDIVEETAEEKYVFYEIKTYPVVLHSFRIAIGQLLEYAYYPKQKITDKFIIVTHLEAHAADLDYLDHISRELNISIQYMWFDLESKTVK